MEFQDCKFYANKAWNGGALSSWVRTFGCTTSPEGTWNKAAVTSNFMLFLEDFCQRRSDLIEQHERLRIFVSLQNLYIAFLVFTNCMQIDLCTVWGNLEDKGFNNRQLHTASHCMQYFFLLVYGCYETT